MAEKFLNFNYYFFN